MNNKTNVLAICEALIPSAIIGVCTALKHLQLKGAINFRYLNSADVKREDIEPMDVVICIRGTKEKDLDIVRFCNKLNKYVIYFLDDDFWGITPNAGELYRYYTNNDVKYTMYSIMKTSDCLWTSSENIRRKYGSFFNKAVVLDAPAVLLNENSTFNCNRNNSKITIGFAGSLFYGNYIDKFLNEPIKIITDKYGDKVQFEIFGPKPPGVAKYGVKYIPPTQNFDEYIKIMKSRKWDIAFSALEPSEFNSCKYFIKFLDYAAIGAAGIYTCIQPYTNIVEHLKNGILVDNTAKYWINAFEYLITNPTDRLNIQQQAYNHIKTKFNVDYISDMIVKNIPQIVYYKSSRSNNCNSCNSCNTYNSCNNYYDD